MCLLTHSPSKSSFSFPLTHICIPIILAPTLVVDVKPSAVIALDHRPYNTFTLRCFVSASEGVVLPKSFVWKNGDNVTTDNGSTILIAYHNTTLPQSISELTIYRPAVGTYLYSCDVSISVPGGRDISVNDTGSATVKGNSLIVMMSAYPSKTLLLIYSHRSKCTLSTQYSSDS